MYPSCLDNVQWTIFQAFLPKRRKRGRPRLHPYRRIINGILYILRSGAAWRMLPKDFPPWQTVYHYFRKWRDNGLFERLCHASRARIRRMTGKYTEPSAGVVDSQSVKSIGQKGSRGFNGHKMVKGRKRQILVDTEG